MPLPLPVSDIPVEDPVLLPDVDIPEEPDVFVMLPEPDIPDERVPDVLDSGIVVPDRLGVLLVVWPTADTAAPASRATERVN